MSDRTTVLLTSMSLVQAENDTQLIDLWLHGRSAETKLAYRKNVRRFLDFVGKPLPQVTLRELQAFVDQLTGAAASRRLAIAALKSLFSFGSKITYLRFNIAAVVRSPKVVDRLAERILAEADVQKMIALTESRRNQLLLRVLYGTGVRVSELCGLTWRNLQPNGSTGQITVFGKGGKTRAILLKPKTWNVLLSLRANAGAADPVFRSQKGGHLDVSQIRRIVYAAAARAGLPQKVSPHWLRHAHASHALDRNAPIHLVQVTLGHRSVSTTGRYLHARPAESSSLYLPE